MSSKRSLMPETAHTNSNGSRMAGCPAVIEIYGIICKSMMNRK